MFSCLIDGLVTRLDAAGLYGAQFSEPGHKVSDFVTSSYVRVTTLSILVPPRTQDTNPSRHFRLLAVPQPSSDGHFPFPGVHVELEHIRAIIRNSPSAQTTLVEPLVGTIEVLAQMKEAHWVHFACGIQDSENHTDSGLYLADQRRLKLSDIVSLSRARGGFAFLSACQTATGDKDLSDEAIHIVAGMLFASRRGDWYDVVDRASDCAACGEGRIRATVPG